MAPKTGWSARPTSAAAAPQQQQAGAPQNTPAEPSSPASPSKQPVVAPPMALVIRENDAVTLAIFDGKTIVDPKEIMRGADVSECNVAFDSVGTAAKTFAFADLQSVTVVDIATGAIAHRLPSDKVVQIQYSPRGSLIATYSHPDPKRTDGNLAVYNVRTGALVIKCSQGTWPALQWTHDEHFCIRSTTGVLAVHDGLLAGPEPLSRLEVQLPREKSVELSPSPTEQPFVGLFMPHHKTSQASFRVFRMPNFKEDMLSLNFGRAEGASVQWSASGAFVALTLKMETDKSGKSYYGTTALNVVSVRDRTSVTVPLSKDDYVHDLMWSPTLDEFIVVHGPMPNNKATLYNSKAQPLFTFGEAPRNLVRWAPNGKMFALGGTGNLAGDFQFYDRDAAASGRNDSNGGKLGHFSEKSSIQVWAPDSRHLTCTTVFTKLRVDNRIVVWKHSGERVFEKKYTVLQEASWAPADPAAFPRRSPSPTVAAVEKPKAAAYRPPVASAAAAALLARPSVTSAGAQKAKPVGPVGGGVIDPKKKVKR